MGVMDLREKKTMGGDMMMSENNKKFCTDCKTTKTPLWRGGPAGPKSLCNACGIRYRKKRRAVLGLSKVAEKKKEKSQSSNSKMNDVNDEKSNGHSSGLSQTVRMGLYALGSEVLLQRSLLLTGVVKKQRCQRRRKLGEEEQAAFSLMALSCGSVLA